MALVSELPYEILSLILRLACLDDFRDRPLAVGEKFRHFPTILSHVNQQFRNVALTTAKLWARIYIEYDESQSRSRLCRHLELCLERSGDVPLDIEIMSNFQQPDMHPSFRLRVTAAADVFIKSIMEILLPCSSRWRSFCPSFRDDKSFVALILLCDEPAPVLERFEGNLARRLIGVVVRNPSVFQPASPALQGFKLFRGQAPLLESVRLGWIPDFPWCEFLLSNLKHLDMGRNTGVRARTLAEWMTFLRLSPQLEFLAIEGLFDSKLHVPEWNAERTTLEFLRNLQLIQAQPQALVYFLKALNLPRLQCFTFRAIGTPPEDDELPLYLSSQRYPNLSRLEMSLDSVSTAWTRRLFEGLPTIEELHTVGMVSSGLLPLIESDDELQRERVAGAVLLPKLRWLGLGRYMGQEVVSFVSGRHAIDGGTLTHLAVNAVDKPNYSDSQLDFLRSVLHFRFSDVLGSRANIWFHAPPIPCVE